MGEQWASNAHAHILYRCGCTWDGVKRDQERDGQGNSWNRKEYPASIQSLQCPFKQIQIQPTCHAVALLYYSGTFIVRDLRSQMADIMRILISLTEKSVDNTCQMFQGVWQKCLTSGRRKSHQQKYPQLWWGSQEILWHAKFTNVTILIISEYEILRLDKWLQQFTLRFPRLSYLGPIQIKIRQCTLSSTTLQPHWSHWASSWWLRLRGSSRGRTGTSMATSSGRPSSHPSFGSPMPVFSSSLPCFFCVSSLIEERKDQ